MALTKELTFKPYWKEPISHLWNLIDRGWSVVSCTYNYNKSQFTVKLSEKSWPVITIECSRCREKFLPLDLLFKPSPSRQCYCVVCNSVKLPIKEEG